jgi:hypothetical protein
MLKEQRGNYVLFHQFCVEIIKLHHVFCIVCYNCVQMQHNSIGRPVLLGGVIYARIT